MVREMIEREGGLVVARLRGESKPVDCTAMETCVNKTKKRRSTKPHESRLWVLARIPKCQRGNRLQGGKGM